MRALWVAGAVVVVGLLAGCSSDPPVPVPTVAVAPFVCDGVPLEGVEILLGGDVTTEERGGWGADGLGFGCTIHSVDDDGPTLMILERGLEYGFLAGGRDDASELEKLLEQGEPTRVVADFPGVGVLFGPGAPSAAWVCDGRELSVELFADDWDQDRRVDVERLLVSMLPWACGGESAPTADATAGGT